MTFGSKRFEVDTKPWQYLGAPNLSNLSDFNAAMDDDERLKWIYTNYYKNQASFDPYTKQFFPNFGQLEGGAGGQIGSFDNINPGYNGGIFDVTPRMNPVDNSYDIGCPAGFYQNGSVCLPGVDLRGGSGSDLAGGPFGNYLGQGDAKGIIQGITPPQFTYKNQEFIVLTDVQNIGGKPAQFFTKINIPELNIVDDVSNPVLITALSKAKIGHRVIMPTTAPNNALVNASVQLVRIPLDTSGGTGQQSPFIDATGNVSIPTPGYRGGPNNTTGIIPPYIGGQNGIPMPMPFPQPGGFPGGFGGGPFAPPIVPWRPYSGPMYFPPPPQFGGMPRIMINPRVGTYPAGATIFVTGNGFAPNEDCVVQLYSVTNTTGLTKLKSRLVNKKIKILPNGYFPHPVDITIPGNINTPQAAVIAYGSQSKVKVQAVISIYGITNTTPSPSSGGGGINIGPGGINIGGLGNIGDWVNDLVSGIMGNVGIGSNNNSSGNNNNPFGNLFGGSGGNNNPFGNLFGNLDPMTNNINRQINNGIPGLNQVNNQNLQIPNANDIQSMVNQMLAQAGINQQ